MKKLRSQLIRLAYAKPHLRKHILPLVKKGGRQQDEEERVKAQEEYKQLLQILQHNYKGPGKISHDLSFQKNHWIMHVGLETSLYRGVSRAFVDANDLSCRKNTWDLPEKFCDVLFPMAMVFAHTMTYHTWRAIHYVRIDAHDNNFEPVHLTLS